VKWVKKILLFMFAIFAIFYLVTQPENAAAAVRRVFDAVAMAFSSIIVFFSSLAE
jgi:hypothetical protein